MEPGFYKERPKQVQAMQVPTADPQGKSPTEAEWLEEIRAVAAWCRGKVILSETDAYIEFREYSSADELVPVAVPQGDWIVRGRGESVFTRMLDRTFRNLYEEI